MKKTIIGMGLSFTCLLPALPAYATDTNSFAQCVVVPLASFSNDGSSTTVGLTSNTDSTVHWQYYDEGGARMGSGSFAVSQNNLSGFSLADSVSPILANLDGFLLFCSDENDDGIIDGSDSRTLAANAFRVKRATSDVIYVPTIPLFENNLQQSNRAISGWSSFPGAALPVGGGPGNDLHLQYFVNGIGGDGESTVLHLFSTTTPPATIDVTVSGPDDNTTTATLTLANKHLNVIDLEDISTFVDPDFTGSGNILWQISGAGSVFAFSVIESALFSAAQTLMGNVDPGSDDSSILGSDLVVDSVVPATTTPVPNQRFLITTTVRNAGNEPAAATTLQLFLSFDSTLDETDFMLSATPDSLGILQSAETTVKVREVNAPGSPGNYWIGACIAADDSEAVIDNNCSAALPITVVP